MKNLINLILGISLILCSVTKAEIKSLTNIMAKANIEEKKDLPKLLEQITLVPTNDPKTNKTVMKITGIHKGSVYEREGLKVGDLVSQ